MRRLHYGHIEHLTLHGGEPDLDASPPRLTREIKFPSHGGPRPDPDGDFLLKAQVVDLFRVLDSLHGNVVTIEVRDGLPFRLFITYAAI
jgi:hypothetical protein